MEKRCPFSTRKKFLSIFMIYLLLLEVCLIAESLETHSNNSFLLPNDNVIRQRDCPKNDRKVIYQHNTQYSIGKN